MKGIDQGSIPESRSPNLSHSRRRCLGTAGVPRPRPYEWSRSRAASLRSPKIDSALVQHLMHCFLQCTRAIHSTRAENLRQSPFASTGRTSGVRRQNAVSRSGFSRSRHLKPLLLPTKARRTHAPRQTLGESPPGDAEVSPTRLRSGHTVPLGPFVVAIQGITPESQRTGHDCLAMHGSLAW
jgi:hypothetical protein